MRATARAQKKAVRPQFTIRRIMVLIAGCAVVLAITGSAIGSSLIALFLALCVRAFRSGWFPDAPPDRKKVWPEPSQPRPTIRPGPGS
jgi:hypothetical protein